tara:strand:- start:5582 stop:6658 length:1077 start_codon:yes stop_codon:yes gene_type:complete
MNKLIDRLKRYRVRDFVYFLTPPIFYKIFSMLGSSNNSRPKLVDDSNFSHELSMLEEKGMDYFINEDVIKIFCNKSRKQLLESSYGEIDNDKEHYLDKLDKNGYVIVENVFESDTLNKINKSLSKIIDKEVDHLKDLRRNSKSLLISDAPTKNVEGLKCVHNIADGIIRIWNVDNYLPEIKQNIDASEIFSICNSYLSGKAGPSNIYIDIKSIPDAYDSSCEPHSDSAFKICKVFIALEDITLDNAPFLYFKGSHKPHHFRLLKDLMHFSHHNNKYHDSFAAFNYMGMFKFAESENSYFEPVTVELKAGDAIITDTRGIHAATSLKKGRRVQLGLVYADRDYDMSADYNISHLVKDSH